MWPVIHTHIQLKQSAEFYKYHEELAAKKKKMIEEFPSKVAIGTETHCGLVIQMRGPLSEVAVPANVRLTNGAPSFWMKTEKLLPPDVARCDYE